jgi:hypothetical protein
VKGISSLMILDATMERVKQIEQGKGSNDNSQRLHIKYLDLAGGDKHRRSYRPDDVPPQREHDFNDEKLRRDVKACLQPKPGSFGPG